MVLVTARDSSGSAEVSDVRDPGVEDESNNVSSVIARFSGVFLRVT